MWATSLFVSSSSLNAPGCRLSKSFSIDTNSLSMLEWNIFTHSWFFLEFHCSYAFNIYHSYFTHYSRLNGSTSPFGFLASILHNLYNAFNIFGTIVGLVPNLAECKRPVITKRLQCPRTDTQFLAYIVVVHPLVNFLLTVSATKVIHSLHEVLKLGNNSLKDFLFKTDDVHCCQYFRNHFLFISRFSSLYDSFAL